MSVDATQERVADVPPRPALGGSTTFTPYAPPDARLQQPQRTWQTPLALSLLLLTAIGAAATLSWLPHWLIASHPAWLADLPLAETDRPALEPLAAKAAAETAMAALVPAIEALQHQHAENWASTEFAALEAAQARSLQAYRTGRYTAARQACATAAAQIVRAKALIPNMVREAMQRGEQSLLNQHPDAAVAAFRRTLDLAPENAAARRGLRSAENFDQVQTLLSAALNHEQAMDLGRAMEDCRAALALDPEAPMAKQLLGHLEQLAAAATFKTLMSRGFAAMVGGDYVAAETIFSQAAKQYPHASDAINALAQTRARAIAARLDHVLGAARRAAGLERWQEAAALYDSALTLDNAVVIASEGKHEAATRRVLDERLQGALMHPARGADPTAYRETVALLAEARAVPQPGPRLTNQISTLKARLHVTHASPQPGA